MTLDDGLPKACIGHGAWKTHLAQAIRTGHCKLDLQQAGADCCCDFGHWLYALPAETRRSSYWEGLRNLHAQFHQQAALLLRLALDGHGELAKLAMAPDSGFAMLSADLAAELRLWRKDLDCAATSRRRHWRTLPALDIAQGKPPFPAGEDAGNAVRARSGTARQVQPLAVGLFLKAGRFD